MYNIASNRRIARNTLLLYFRQLLIMTVSLYTSRVVLQTLGVVDFGIFNVVGGVVAMFSFLMSTMASASQRYLAYDLAVGDSAKLKETFGLIMLTYILLALITVVLIESIAVWFLNSKMTIPTERIVAANWVLQFAILTFLAHIFATPYLSVVIAHEQMDVYAYVSVADVVLKLLIVYLIKVFLFDKLITYSILIFISSLFITICYWLYCYKKYPESHFRFFYDKTRYRDMTAFAWWNMIGTVANLLRSQGINILLNIFFNPAINAARGIAYQVNVAITQFYTNFYTAVKPQIVKNFADGNIERMNLLIFNSTRYAYYLIFCLATPLLFYTDLVLDLWLGTPPEFTSLFVKVILVNSLVETLSMPLVSGLQAANKIKALQLTVSILYLLNLPVSYLLLWMGFPAVTPMYVNIVIVIIAFIPRILLSRKYINISIRDYSQLVLYRLALVTLVGVAISYGIFSLLKEANALLGIPCIAVVSFLVVSIWGVNKKERMILLNYIKNKLS